ncbi:copper chaperone [Proteiniborus ethanoligenes]|uniref:Copper chaperone n=1 Tax=Proteiniborus ethanoligenes TaxID=415015 RepID=A0A1H3M2S0_9FIRM|nr:copper ion binding protein [Proteiniborus ethanoligenes]SDY71012.1 copper chaperone [Proteiniborus ethanoligenes]
MKKTLTVEGMSCQHCVKAVKDALGQIEGVKTVEVDLTNHSVEIEGDNLVHALLKEAIEEAGYNVI